MTDRPRVLVVRNDVHSGPGRLVDWLTEAGLDASLVEGPQLIAGEHPPVTMDGAAGLVMLGGGFMPDAEERAPWLPVERQFIEHAATHRVPVLGICLGGQLLALHAGGEVTENSGETERGSCPVEMLPAAAADPLFGPLFDPQLDRQLDPQLEPPFDPPPSHRTLRMMQNHRDSVTSLPPGATLLATSPECGVQAFRVGECAWGLQFHPEAAAERVSGWDADRLRAEGFDRAALIARAEADAPVNEVQARTLLGTFANLVRGGKES